ncbi:hypothetical protein WA026_001973 [Henosepilachna vigintioctopunctata]|uniref:glucose-6-phosphate 1-epimerase n=1 Tax=Henosepilachna vigintioctopunctata TaxID=420089 RepID=A0AAW1UJI9_9CUCU
MDMKTLDCIYLDRGENIQCTISRFGANIISWVVHGVEQLFCSRKTVYDNLKAINGGIMLIFPNYGYWSLGPSNGFANLMNWKIYKDPVKLPTGDIQVILELEQCQVSDTIWNFSFNIRYTITLLEKEIELDFSITNLSPYSFYFEFLFSNHIRVPDIRNCKIQGLENSRIMGHTNGIYMHKQEEDEVEIDGEYLKVFVGTGDKIKVTNVMADVDMMLEKTNLPDTILQSPWEEKAKTREDFCADEWNKMLILEVGHKYKPLRLFPNENFESLMKLSVKSEEDRNSFVIRFY